MSQDKRFVRINQKIRASEVRVIGPDGNQLGIMPASKALSLSQQQGLDLIEIAPNATPPVCKIMGFGKYKYEQSKKEREIRHNQVDKIKEMQFNPNIGDHDYQTKLRHIREFLENQMKVRVIMTFHGREMIHQEFGRNVIQQLIKDVADLGVVESPPKLLGKNLNMSLRPGKAIPAKSPVNQTTVVGSR